MLRRRILSGFFKFGIKGPSDTKYDVNDISISYDYGKTKVIEYTELGTVIGTDINYATITEDGEQKTYYKLIGNGPGTVNIAILNFTTYVNNQTITLKANEICDSENDFLAVCHLDATDKDHIKAKISKNESKTITFDVVNKGSHFIKIYYYQHNDNTVEKEGYPNDPPHGNEHYGCFRLEPWKYTYKDAYDIDAYDKPDSQSIYIRSYYGWDVVNKSNLPSWIQLNMTEAKQGNKKLDITLAANHGVQRTYNLVIRERKINEEITISISQGANPHPNDILLNINNANTTSDKDSATNIDVKLLGLNSYSVTNPNTTEFDYTKTDLTEIEDSEYSDMSIKESKLTIIKKNTNNVNPATFIINGLNVNGTKVMQKNIVINSDKVSCYCDCNQYNKCQCDVEQFNYKQECSGCPLHSYGCNSHDANASNCPKHCSANENYRECSGHSTCICNTDSCRYSACVCVWEADCPSYACNCNGNSCSKSVCSCNTYYPCNGDCGSNGYREVNYVPCNPNNGCYSYSCVNCSGKNCGCYGGVCAVDCATEWSSTYYDDIYVNIELSYSGVGTQIYVPYLVFEFSYNGAQRTIVTRSADFYMNNNASRSITLPYIAFYGNNANSTRYTYIKSIKGYGILPGTGNRIFSAWQIYSPSTSYIENQTNYLSITGSDPGNFIRPYNNQNWEIKFSLTSESWSGAPAQCPCDNDVGVCRSNSCVYCGSKTVRYLDCNSNCASQCAPDNTCGCHGYSCTCYGERYRTCSCDGQCSGVGCNCNDESPCPSYSCTCYGNTCSKSACTCESACHCNAKRTDCTCNTKLYYPYCSCETKCECYNYTFPEECKSHNCKSDENTCNCNSQVTCSAKSLY